MITDTIVYSHEALAEGKNILIEGVGTIAAQLIPTEFSHSSLLRPWVELLPLPTASLWTNLDFSMYFAQSYAVKGTFLQRFYWAAFFKLLNQ